MEFLKRNRKPIGFTLFVFAFCFLFRLPIFLCAADPSSEKGKDKEVQKIIDQSLNKNDVKILGHLKDYPEKILGKTSEKDILKIYQKHKKKLLSDEHSDGAISSQQIRALLGFLKIVKAVDSERIFKLLEDDIKHIKLIKKGRLSGGWNKSLYYHHNVATYIFRTLVKRYGPGKIDDLHQRLVKLNRPRLRLRLFLSVMVSPDTISGHELEYIKVLAKITSNSNFNQLNDLKAEGVMEDFRNTLIRNMYRTYKKLNKEQKKEAESVFKKYKITELQNKIE